MTRRQSIRRATLLAFALALGKYDALAQEAGHLTVDLNQWQGLTFKFGKETVFVSSAEVFAALKAGQ